MEAEKLAELVERQNRRWEIERRAGMPQPRGAVVSVSRLPWAGGEELAEQVAGWLDYGLFELETIARIAADPALGAGLVAELRAGDREAIDARVQEVFGGLAAGDAMRDVARMISTLGQRGMAVVVGRGASAILPAARTLRVLVVAPVADRAARLAAARGLSAAEAEQRLAAEDAARRSFLRDRLGVEGDDPLAYDLVVNLEHLSTDAGAALVVDALRRRFPPAGARPGR
jgi:hypothetical protein